MPHLHLEYSRNVPPPTDLQPLFAELHQLLHEEAAIRLENIKSRAVRCDDFRVGGGHADHGFVHLSVRFLDGRSTHVRRRIGELALAALERHFGSGRDTLQLTVEVGEIEQRCYCKSPAGTLPQRADAAGGPPGEVP